MTMTEGMQVFYSYFSSSSLFFFFCFIFLLLNEWHLPRGHLVRKIIVLYGGRWQTNNIYTYVFALCILECASEILMYLVVLPLPLPTNYHSNVYSVCAPATGHFVDCTEWDGWGGQGTQPSSFTLDETYLRAKGVIYLFHFTLFTGTQRT